MDPTTLAFQLIALLIGFCLHEAGHAYCANYLGDPTAKHRGRLTLNPIKHLDPFGSVILPLMLILAQAPFLFAAAKPVPVNPGNFRRPQTDFAIVALAGPMVNILLALLAAVAYGLVDPATALGTFLNVFIIVNAVLAIFNLLPIPPLDGSKIVAGFLPRKLAKRLLALDRAGFLILIALLVLGSFTGFDVIRIWIGFMIQAFEPLLQQAAGL